MEFLRAPRRAHPVDLDHDESEFRQRLRIAARRRKTAAPDAARLRTGIDVVDDRIFLRRVEVRRLEHQAVEIGDAVARLHRDRNRRLPSGREQLRDVGLLERRDQLAVRVAQHRDRRHVGLRIAVDEIFARGRERNLVIGVLRRQQRQILAVEADAIEMNEIRIAALLAARRRESTACRFFSSTRSSCVTLPSPVVIWFFSLPVVADRTDRAGPSCRARRTR